MIVKSKRILALLLAMLMVLGAAPTALADETEDTGGGALSFIANVCNINEGGDYTVPTGSSGVIYVDTAEAVRITGTGVDSKFASLSIICTNTDGSNLIIEDLFISAGYNGVTYNDTANGINGIYNVIRFAAAENNKLTIAGTNVLETPVGGAIIHVGASQSLTILGKDDAKLYLYKSGAWTAIGGNGSEANGEITIDLGNAELFAKGSAMGAVIGSGSYCANTPGDITIKSGRLNLIANARGALIGLGAGGSATSSGNVYITGGSVNCNVDWTGAAIGASGSGAGPKEGNVTAGDLVVSGGSLRVYLDENAASKWGKTSSGVDPVGITANKVDDSGEPVYMLTFDTEELAESGDLFTVQIDGSAFYKGGLHGYCYYNETVEKAQQNPISDTTTNWIAGDDSNLYFYVTGENHTLTVNGESFDAVWDGANESFTIGPAGGGSQVWDGSTIDTSWYNDSDTVFVITTPEELAGFASLVNGGNTFADKTVKLGNDIALDEDGKYTAYDNVRYGTASYAIVTTQYVIDSTANVWTPIGAGEATDNTTLSSSVPFAGIFDGQGYTISGIYTGTTDETVGNTATVQGLFGVVTGTVKNVTTSGCITGKAVLGGVTAYLNGGTVENCTNNAIVFGDGGTKPNGNVENGTNRLGAIGGITGNAMTGSAVTGCVNNADITCANSNAGGRTGGILGLINNEAYVVTIKNCLNNGDVDSYQYVGGVIGGNWSKVSPIENCGNTGTITGFSSGSTYVGGITPYSASHISNCYNTGDYSIHIGGSAGNKAAHAGGIVSDLTNSSIVTNCYNTGNFINAGYATVTSTSLGGICGTGYGTSSANRLTNCYTTANSGHAFEDLSNSCAILKTSDEMKTIAFLIALSGAGRAFVADSAEAPVNQGYPVLRVFTDQNGAALVDLTKGNDPVKLSYVAGETFDATGLEVWANYSDSTRELVTGYTASKTGALNESDTSITVSGTYNGQQYSYSFAISVDSNSLSELTVTAQPSVKMYYAGEAFDTTGMVVKATYTNGTTVTLNRASETNTDGYTLNKTTLAKGDDTATVSYTYVGVTKTVNITGIEVVDEVDTLGSVYLLNTTDDMRWFSARVNSGKKTISAKLVRDIDLSEVTWMPIGNSSTNAFAGTFAGDGNTVTLSITGTDTYRGLFGYVGAGTVKNTTVAGSITGGSYVGGVTGRLDGAGVIENCVNKAKVTGTTYSGGIVGAAYPASGTGSVQNCANLGAVTGTGYVGGITGYLRGANIYNCYNNAAVTATATTAAQGVGGIVGYTYTANAEIFNVYNAGVITTAGASAGALIGYVYNNTALSGYYLESTASAAYQVRSGSYTVTGTFAAKSEVEMKTAEFLTELNGTGDAYVADADDINGGYPILAFQYIDEGSSTETDWSAVTSFEDGQTYYISSATNLVAMSALVNAGHSGANSAFVLTEDIDLADSGFAPIGTVTVNAGSGTYTLGNPFSGVFDGDGHTISGLSLEDESGGVALFAYSTGTICNLTILGTVIGNYFTAGVVASGSGKMENVISRVAVTAQGNCVGGILAEATGDVTIKNCHNQATITNGGEGSEKSTGRIAGIVGRVEAGHTATITECSNTANITGYQYVAGIIGGSFGDVMIDACYNSGNITGISFGKVYLGGIAGKLEGGTISNCYNTGNLYDAHWSQGHIRAVGGIVGCEEQHTVGTAITNCYTTGKITFNTSNMVSGTNFIYMTGNISGGNSSTSSNTMSYENCFYLSGALTIADENHESYRLWSEVYKNNPLAYDTAYITGCTAEDLKGDEVLMTLGDSFTADEASVNGGYPVLYWQVGEEAPVMTSGVEIKVTGGAADVMAVSFAQAGTEVSVSITNVEAGKQLKAVTAVDTSGAKLAVTESGGYYTFTMPARPVTITVTLENQVTSNNTYALTLPDGLDAIWNVSVDSTYYEGNQVTEGATVTIVVSKEVGAVTTSFTGITVREAGGSQTVDTAEGNVHQTTDGARVYAEYTFTMPAYNVTVSLEQTYSDLTVRLNNGTGSQADVKKYTRADMEKLAESGPVYYSGWSSETEALIGRGDTAISLLKLLDDAGLTFVSGDSLVVTAADGMSLTYTYNDLIGTERFYYADIFENDNLATKKTALTPILVLKGNIALNSSELGTMVSDTLNTYRFIYGQSEAELTGNVKCVDTMPKCVTSITIVKAKTNAETVNVTFDTTPQNATVVVTDSEGKAVTPEADKTYILSANVTYSYTVSAYGYITRAGSVTPTEDMTVKIPALISGDPDAESITDFSGTWDWDTKGYYDISWYNRDDTEFCLTTNKQLAGLAWIVNQGNQLQLEGESEPRQEFFTDKTIYLGADIYLNDHDLSGTGSTGDAAAHQWPSIAGGDSTNERNAVFDGTFDGQGHTIYNLYIYNLTAWGEYAARNRGLFGVTAEAALIQNVTVQDGFLRAARSTGAIVGKTGSLSANYDSTRTGHGTWIENCHNVNTTIITTDSKGVGGIAGSFWNEPIMRYCSNSGAIASIGEYPVGGMAGESEGTIEYCYNTGTISSAGNNAGGIVGSNKMSTSSINDCYNTGTVKGAYAGGITGYQVGLSKNCYSVGSVSGTNAGALFGELASGTRTNTNLYYLTGSCAAGVGKLTSGANNTAAKTADELKSAEFLVALNDGGDAFAADSRSINNGYPVLSRMLSETVKVTFVTGEGSPVEAQTIARGEKVTEPEVPTRTGFTFTGWYTSDTNIALITLYNFDTLVTSDLTLYAGWTENSIPSASDYTVTFTTYPKQATVTVWSGGNEVLAQANGSYLLANGNYTYTVSAKGYVTQSKEFTVNGEGWSFEITLVKEGSDVHNVAIPTYPKRAGLVVYDSDGNVIKPNDDGTYDLADGTYDYVATMPGYKDAPGSFTIENGELKDLGTITLTAAVNLDMFTDVNTGLWYKNAVEYSVAGNLFSGTGDTTWEPDTALTRAMFVTVLGKYSGIEGNASATCSFNDVDDGQWYTAFVQWAYEEELVEGTGNGNFSPSDSITRQEMSMIFWKYVNKTGTDMTADATKYNSFTDNGEAASWAVTALTWATDRRIMNGDDQGRLLPTGTATRSQAAQVFMVIIENIL